MALIDNVLEMIRRRLDAYFQASHPRPGDWVVLSNVADHQGAVSEDTKDKVVMFLANIQNDTTISTYNRNVPVGEAQYVVAAPPIYINLYVLFMANFYNKQYREGLTVLSETIGFFQQNPVFTHDNLPGLDGTVDKIAMEITNLDLTQASYLMGMMGVKYLPSVYYRIRMLPFAGEAIQGTTGGVRDLG